MIKFHFPLIYINFEINQIEIRRLMKGMPQCVLVDEISIINIRFFNVHRVVNNFLGVYKIAMLKLNKIIEINYFHLQSSECDFFKF